MDALKLLKEQLKSKSLGKIAKELDVSKTSLCLIRSKKYPNPQKMYQRIKEQYGTNQEIIGAEVTADLSELAKELECI